MAVGHLGDSQQFVVSGPRFGAGRQAKEEERAEMGGTRAVAGRVAGCVMVTAALAVAGVGAWPSTPGAGASSAPDFSVVAGGTSATDTPTSEGSSALSTRLKQPQAVAVDARGNVVICDTNRNEIEVLAESTSNPGYVIGSGAVWAPGSMYVIVGNG
ncbi:MAG: hypothetical protein ABSA08_07505, partial [Acidimicrobiales bacterium]